MTLLMLLSLTAGFKTLSNSISDGRAKLNMNDRLRGVSAIIENDLENITVELKPRLKSIASTGYFEYYDGPMSDSTLSALNIKAGANDVNDLLPTSRFGDLDDFMAMTVRADGEWFKGKVPLALLKAKENQIAIDNGIAPVAITASDWQTPVVISSEYAEVVYFVSPLGLAIDAVGDPVFPPGPDTRDAIVGGTLVPNVALPAGYQLHRRVLLIRPDLNVTSFIPSGNSDPQGPHLCADSQTVGGLVTTSDPLANQPETLMLAMARAFQNADLSMRQMHFVKPVMGGGLPSPIVSTSANNRYLVANSLQDLSRRENRFAHWVRYSLPESSLGDSTTMPLIALTGYIPGLHGRTYAMPVGSVDPSIFRYCGFLRPEFILGGARTGEDVLLSSTLGFDIQGFDSTAWVLNHPGPDGQFGVPIGGGGFSGIAGEYGSDDLALTPADVGYPFSANGGPATANQLLVKQGAFVDLCWFNRFPPALVNSPPLLINTDFSGVVGNGRDVNFPPSFFKSGQVFFGNNDILYQPTYDTSSTFYEIDGYTQSTNGTLQGVFWINGRSPDQFNVYGGGGDVGPVSDLGTDGLDSNGDLRPDDKSEEETATSFPVEMKSIRVQLRIQDSGSGDIQQTSLIQGFVGR
jgi:hypothetical protein